MMEIKIVEIGVCICNKKVYTQVNPNPTKWSNVFINYMHEDFTPICSPENLTFEKQREILRTLAIKEIRSEK